MTRSLRRLNSRQTEATDGAYRSQKFVEYWDCRWLSIQRRSACRPSGSAELLLQDVARRLIPGAVMLIARGGRIGFVEAIGFCDREAGAPMNLDAIFRIASMTKPITSVAAMILAEEGKLQIAAPVADYLPELGAANGHGRRYVILTQHAARRNPLRERFHTVCLILAIRRQPYSC